MEKTCEICGGWFTASRKTQKYCPECGKNTASTRRKFEKAVRRNKVNAGDAYHVREQECRYCGKKFATSFGLTFCSHACEKQYRIEHATCTQCGKNLFEMGITIENTNGGARFCSDECREKHRWDDAERRGNISVCKRCGKKFIRKQGTFCSKDCYKEAVKDGWTPEPDVPKQEPNRERVRCKVCGKPFTRILGNTWVDCCSPECRKRAVKAQMDKRAADKQKADMDALRAKGLCICCKTPYAHCERMQSSFQYSPKGAKLLNGKVIECPKFWRWYK